MFRKLFPILTKIQNATCAHYYSTTIQPVSMSYNLYSSTGSEGDSPPLVIMHGLFGSKTNWRGMSKALLEKFIPNRKIIAVDARNHGESPHTEEHSYTHLAEDVAHFLKEQNITRAAVMGHSMGGRAMMYLALKYPNLVERAIIVDISPIDMPRDFMETERIFTAMKSINIPSNLPLAKGRAQVEQQMKKVITDKGTVDFILQNLKKSENGQFIWKTNVYSLHKNFRNIAIFPKDITETNQYRGPVLFVGGSHSNFINPNDFPKIQKIFINSNLIFLNAGHLVHYEQPYEFIKLVTNFMNQT